MKTIMPESKGKADGKVINEVVTEYVQRIKEKKHEIVYADEGIFGSGCVSENGES